MQHLGNRFIPLKELIYSDLKNKILNLHYKPGQIISETEISEQLKVSRTPVREIFIRLSYEKLINIYPQKGTFVALIDLPFTEESVYMRNIIESHIVHEIIDKQIKILPQYVKKNINMQRDFVENEGSIEEFLELDNEFHRSIFKTVNHETIWDIISKTKIHYNRYRVLTMYEPKMIEKVYKEHCNIVAVIESGDKSACDTVLKEHHFSGLEHADLLKKKYPDYFSSN